MHTAEEPGGINARAASYPPGRGFAGVVLVAYATKSGATAEIARTIGEELRLTGLRVDVRPVEEVGDVTPYDAVLLGSAIYLGKWRREALEFGESQANLLRTRPVWLFDSGPLFNWPDEGRNEPVRKAEELRQTIGARSRTTFGGKLMEEDAGFLTRRLMAGGKAGSYGDFRNLARVRMWARAIAKELLELQPAVAAR